MSKIPHNGAVVERSSGETAERTGRTLFAPPTSLSSRQEPAAIRLDRECEMVIRIKPDPAADPKGGTSAPKRRSFKLLYLTVTTDITFSLDSGTSTVVPRLPSIL